MVLEVGGMSFPLDCDTLILSGPGKKGSSLNSISLSILENVERIHHSLLLLESLLV